MRIGYLGPNTNSEIAAGQIAGPHDFMAYFPQIEGAFIALRNKQVDRIVVPVKNSITGNIGRHLDLIGMYRLSKVGELEIPIVHCLGSRNGLIVTIMSHPEALKQCADYLNRRYEGVERMDVSSTHEAARLAGLSTGFAAIANEKACINHGLKIVDMDITQGNRSIFWVLEDR